ncbi:MAG: winged helix-turn-helix domain-containing protein, partial [Elusimicrobiota bacterium]|nr:winged helix-turn-helix domain-containing protein [Elusimicrobiota bacterium]
TALEFDLLLYFLKNQGRVVSRTVLLEQVWKQGLEAGPRAVDKRIEALRSRLGPFGSKIRTVFGLGYLFKM